MQVSSKPVYLQGLRRRDLMWGACVQVKMKGGEQLAMPASEAGSICWICGEVAAVEVEIRNPTVIPIKVT